MPVRTHGRPRDSATMARGRRRWGLLAGMLLLLPLVVVLEAGSALPERAIVPVLGATARD